MVELIVLGVLAFCAFVVIGTLVAAASMVGWLITLPFRLVGLVFRGVGLLIGLPFAILGIVIAVVCFGFGALVVLFPLIPVALLVLGAIWLVRHNRRHVATP